MPAPIEYYRAAVRIRRPGWVTPPIELPVLHLHGATDGCVGPELGGGQERFFAGPFSSETVDGAGHFLHLERPVWIAQRTMWWLGRHLQDR
jgi:pimeloyl-ACP methyl ester carboxylesterase